MTIKERNELALANMNLVKKIANEFVHLKSSYTYQDIVQDGFIGLLRAIEKYDTSNENCNFTSYIATYIRETIKTAYNRCEQPEGGHNTYTSNINFIPLTEEYGPIIDNVTELVLKSIHNTKLKKLLHEFLCKKLTMTQVDIIESHYGINGPPITLAEIGKRYGCTRQNISRQEITAFRKLYRDDFSIHKFRTELKKFL